MDWTRGYSAKYYLTIVDRASLKDINYDNPSDNRIELISGSIHRTPDGLRESSDLSCEKYDVNKELFIRVWLDASQNGSASHTPLFTGIASSPSRKIEGNLENTTLQCYSLLKLAEDVLLPRGWYAPYDANSGSLIKQLLGDIGTDIFIEEDSPNLKSAIVAESGESKLTMVDKILNSIGWYMRLDGFGRIYIQKFDEKREAKAMFNPIDHDVIEPTLSVDYDWFNTPNVVRVISDEIYAVARDDDPESPLSTVNRGREVWMEEDNAQPSANESLSEYARRMLKEYQRVSTTVSYDRRYDPDIYPYDIIGLNYPAQKLQGRFLVTDQTITLGFNAKTSEEVVAI